MKHILLSIFLLIVIFEPSSAQQENNQEGKIIVSRLMDSLWISPSSFINHNDHNWVRLNQHLEHVDILQLNQLIYSIYFGNGSFILNKSHADIGFIGSLNKSANEAKNRKYNKKVREGFMDKLKYPTHKTVLIEGDSWFEYPYFLKDITDHLEKRDNLAVYSLAYGSDWFSSMLSSLHYEYEYMKMKPDVFIISGGGNDLVGDHRLSSFISDYPLNEADPYLKDYRHYVSLRMQKKSVSVAVLSNGKYLQNTNEGMALVPVDTTLLSQIVIGRRYLNKNFFRWQATIKLQYKMLFESLRKVSPARFNSIKIITQGYDYPIPNYNRTFGLHSFVKNGEWLKDPLMRCGIIDPHIQKSITTTIIFELNEMLIELGKEYPNIYHVDARGITEYYEKLHHNKPGSGWFDELHPKSKVFALIANVYTAIINNDIPPTERVINVKEYTIQKE